MSQNGQTHFKNLAAFVARFLKCVWPFWDIMHERVKKLFKREKSILSFIRLSPNSTFSCHHSKGIKLLSWLWLGFSHLRKHTFTHSFQSFIKLFCSCGKGEVETISHYLLHCSNYLAEWLVLLNTVKNIGISILQQNDSRFTSVLLTGDTSLDDNKSLFILDATIDYIISTWRLD